MKKSVVIGVLLVGLLLVNLVGVYGYIYRWEKITDKPAGPITTCHQVGKFEIDGNYHYYACTGERPKYNGYKCDASRVGEDIIDNSEDYYKCIKKNEIRDGFKVEEVFWVMGNEDSGKSKVSSGIEPDEFYSTRDDCTRKYNKPPASSCWVYSRESDSGFRFGDDCAEMRVTYNFIFDGTTIDDKFIEMEDGSLFPEPNKDLYRKFSEGIISGDKDARDLIEFWSWALPNSHESYLCRDDGYWYKCEESVEGKGLSSNDKNFKCEETFLEVSNYVWEKLNPSEADREDVNCYSRSTAYGDITKGIEKEIYNCIYDQRGSKTSEIECNEDKIGYTIKDYLNYYECREKKVPDPNLIMYLWTETSDEVEDKPERMLQCDPHSGIDECWMTNSNCIEEGVNQCSCESGYEADGKGGCKLIDKSDEIKTCNDLGGSCEIWPCNPFTETSLGRLNCGGFIPKLCCIKKSEPTPNPDDKNNNGVIDNCEKYYNEYNSISGGEGYCWLMSDTNCNHDTCTCDKGEENGLGGCYLTPTDEDGECSNPLVKYKCKFGTSVNNYESANGEDWTWTCKGTSSSEDCRLKKSESDPDLIVEDGVCGEDIRKKVKFDDEAKFIDFVYTQNNPLCENDVISTQVNNDETGNDYSLGEDKVEWNCITTHCSVIIIDFTSGGVGTPDGNCNGDEEFFTITYTDGTLEKKIWCPVALPFFNFFNIIAVLVIVGMIYFVMEKKKLFK